MNDLVEYFSKVDLGLCVVAGLMIFICAVPFSSVISEIWNSHFKKGE